MYRLEEQPGLSIVIDGFENGIASSPYLGISNIRNLNTSYYSGVAYVNYKRKEATTGGDTFFAGSHSIDVSNNVGWLFEGLTSGIMKNPAAKATSPAGLNYILDTSGQIFKQTAVNSSTFNKIQDGTRRLGAGSGGIAYWNNYLVVFGDGLIEFCGLGTDDDDVISSNWNINNRSVTILGSSSPSQLVYSGSGGEVYLNKNDPVTFTSSGTLPSPLVAGTTYYIKTANVDPVNGTAFQVSATPGGTDITILSPGTGTITITDTAALVPIGNINTISLTLSFDPGVTTTATITSYVSVTGTTVTANWQGASGTYDVLDPTGNNLLAAFTNGSPTVTFLSPLVTFPQGDYHVNILNPDAQSYRAWVSKADGNLYFANGRNLGRILSQNANTVFDPSYALSYVVDYAATEILQPDDQITDMTDSNSTLIISGNKDLYTWDYISPTTTAPSPVGEQIFSIINLLNNVYILAGQKGNIYITNGYSAQLFYKIPDFIAGAIDPVWYWGDLMVHRSKLFFQVLAKTTGGTNILAGVFSLIVSPAENEDAKGLVMETQNSYGLTPASGALQNGVLLDNSPSSTGYDSYYSAWSNGATTGGIDYNDTTLWQDFEPTIETDIIPIGTILDKQTFGNIEFKLDRPMVSGDQIRMYWRPSLSDSYTLMGTTTTAQLSDYYPSNISQSQWAQFKIQMKCASSSSSRIPLREIRLSYN